MKRETKKRAKKASVADLLITPIPAASPNNRTTTRSKSPELQFDFNLNKSKKSSTGTKKNINVMQPTASSSLKTLSTVSDLKDLASSRLDSIKRHLDHSQSEIIKDIEASQSRLHKRYKIQTQASQQVMDEAEKEYKKITERITETRDAMKASYMDFMAEAEASLSRVCKTTIPELAQNIEKAFDAMRSRYGISSLSV